MPLEKEVESLPQPLGQQRREREKEQSFKPFLFVGSWSECRKTTSQTGVGDHGGQERPKRALLLSSSPAQSIAHLFRATKSSAVRRKSQVRSQEEPPPFNEDVPVTKCYGDRGKCRVPEVEVYSEVRFKRDASSRRPSISELFGAATKKNSPPPLGKWSGPDIPPELEISFVASSLAPPLVGTQHREVSCRGRDGEQLPFR